MPLPGETEICSGGSRVVTVSGTVTPLASCSMSADTCHFPYRDSTVPDAVQASPDLFSSSVGFPSSGCPGSVNDRLTACASTGAPVS